MANCRSGATTLPLILLASGAAACGSNGSPAAVIPVADAGEEASTCGSTSAEAGSGSGTIMGSPDRTTFSSVGSSLWIGSPDSDATTVVYLFSRPVGCGELCTPGWDQRISNGTQVLEMKLFGTSPATFTVVTTLTPAPGEAAVNFTLSSTSGTPKEVSGSGGSVTLNIVQPKMTAGGNFSLMFGAQSLSGSFDAPYCPGGHEP